MNAVATPISGAVAVYSDSGEKLRLLIIGLDAAGLPLVLGREGRVAVATMARPRKAERTYNFDAIEATS